MRHRGHALMELVLVVGLIMALGAVIVGTALHVYGTQQVDRAAKEFRDLLRVLDRSSMGHFTGISAQRVASEHLAPVDMIEDGGLRSRWGAIALAPLTLDPRRPHAAVLITYQGIPQDVCFTLVKAMAPGVEAVRVNGTPVIDADGLNLATLGTACEAASVSRIALVHDSRGSGDPALL